MKLGEIKVPQGAVKRRKIVGRGPGSGHGKTSTRGQKGQRSRSGAHIHVEFEGGQMPLIRRVPKRGFTNRFKKVSQVVNLSDLSSFKENSVVTPVELYKEGIIKDEKAAVKILGDGEISKAMTVKAQAFSTSAAEKIAKAGGKTEIIK
ncbi:MAG: 50S ribosomal protein L15 [Candidatus Omnitrophota bacterium]